MADEFVVKRVRDGLFYAGTADSRPVYVELIESAAPFRERLAAVARAEALPGDHEVEAFAS